MCDTDIVNEDINDADFEPSLDVSLLPKSVKNRIKALKKIQFETVLAEEQYNKELHVIDLKYQKEYDEINAKRLKIISGKHEPGGEEIEWPGDEVDEEDKEKGEKELSSRIEAMSIYEDYKEDTKGIPKFWYHVLKNANDDLNNEVTPHDEPVLRSLLDITVELAPENDWFRLNFHFSENKWFTNSVLTKEYKLRTTHEHGSPLEYDGPEISGSTGCKIDWKNKEIILFEESFFKFFTPPEDSGDGSEETKAKLAFDFDDGLTIKEKIIPRAVLYFTGEIFGGEDSDEYEDQSSDEDED